ncbi:MAG TPA: methylenetetrahydrofolate--tRNA-(uracil(54)-C(5))-methyltransferase (FADH(2)-oxidizing) TrmFO [Chloroflexi bacterium]|nr:methylenetetrahydrofolate--tRNA-(uracil(54)-C(5))-methyltransferase (FADH(2)-oxidizing) TrmFO [Chloroflexota bacterium]
MTDSIIVVGGGLAGSEAAWQIAERGIPVSLYEMRPARQTPAHTGDKLAELVCSNSMGSVLPDRAPGLLKNELRRLGSMVLQVAEEASVPAGRALAVDRDRFAEIVTGRIETHPLITLKREEVTAIPSGATVIASGPLTSDALADAIVQLSGEDRLYFYDAVSPIAAADSIDMSIAFRAGRYEQDQPDSGDYINCPFTREEYDEFVAALLEAEKIELRSFEEKDLRENFFEMCLPIEEMARRGHRALSFGPMRPVGLIDPRTGKRPYAVVQLRQDNLIASLYNIVGFQTNLRWPEQKRVLRLIPGLGQAEFARYGMMHRNTYLNAPALLNPTMQWRARSDLFFAGQIVGVEGYIGNMGSGLLAGINAARQVKGQKPITLPRTTMMGSLAYYISHAESKNFQPMKANFGILPPFTPKIRNKRARYYAYAERALSDLEKFLQQAGEQTI